MNDERNEANSNSFLDRVKESPRTVSALIIILIVAAAIYAFSGEPKQPAQDTADNNEVAITSDEAATDMNDQAATPTPVATKAPAATPMATSTPLSQQKLQELRQGLPEAQRDGNAFVEKAQAGDGITHLARRATTRWLADNAAGYAVTNEHRIYIEDYIQNKLGTDRLSLDETRTISFDLIAEAVEHAGHLSEQQLHHLSGYSVALN